MAEDGWNDSTKGIAIAVIITIYIGGMVGTYAVLRPPSPPSSTNTTTTTSPYLPNPPDTSPLPSVPLADLENFSFYTDYEVDFELDAPTYSLQPDLSNVLNLDFFTGIEGWNDAVRDKIAENYFSCITGCTYEMLNPSRVYQQFSEVYDDNYWSNTPSFVTTDAMYHTFHILYDEALRAMERNNLTYYLEYLCQHMVEVSQYQMSEIDDTRWDELARRNLAFFSVALKCLKSTWSVPSEVSSDISEVLALMGAHEGYSRNWFMEQLEDFSQYIPRGHYTKTPELSAFFKAMMWLGRIALRVSPSDDWLSFEKNCAKGQNETGQALLICNALLTNSSYLSTTDVRRLWNWIYLPTAFFVGESDDLCPSEYTDLMYEVYGEDVTLDSLQDFELVDDFRLKAAKLRDPRILADFMFYTDTMENVTKGMCFFGQRSVPDSYMLWELVFPNVGVPLNERFLPKGLDIMDVLGSQRASELLVDQHGYVNYTAQIAMLKNEFDALGIDEWTQNLYWMWLYSLKPILSDFDSDYPSFMKADAWEDKSLVTALGSWTELRHDTVLYAKQSTTGYVCLMNPPPGYVEPAPSVYARLASLCKMMIDGMANRSLLGDHLLDRFSRLHSLLLWLRNISVKELTSTPLSDDEISTLKYMGHTLRYLERSDDDDIDRAAVVTDVHTDPNEAEVLQEATGDPMVIIVAVPYPNGSVYLTRGAMFSYYEFTHPMNDRLTDEAWWEIIDSGATPEMPDWEQNLIGNELPPPSILSEDMGNRYETVVLVVRNRD
ncbi:MAG: DUF3160 domain-containing protein [Candidatus Thorarchaeota archaeon]|nr:DUF3160 domain-containing protein [Candidatus Thorarchaeota archaeon]